MGKILRKKLIGVRLAPLAAALMLAPFAAALMLAPLAAAASPLPVVATAPALRILPEPVSVLQRNGVFSFTATTRICLLTEDREAARIARQFAEKWKTRLGRQVVIYLGTAAEKVSGNILVISLLPREEIKNGEGYIIDIDTRRVDITAPGPAGLFYAFTSLDQLLKRGPQILSTQIYSAQIPCGHILDYPRFPYRGMHLDVSRHFFPVAFIKKYLDILASFKINTFHWHLTDSHGWRIEIKGYPRLTSVGAWRADRNGIPMTIAKVTGATEPATYGGYYTQEQIREIIAYAKERFITIIPEIEMPGHCTAALVAYPQYADLDNKTPLLMPCGYPGDLLHNFCVGYDSTFIFLQNILREVMSLFPSPFIHIGGDEVRDGPWLNCPRCRRAMEANGLSTGRQLQAWFTQRIDSFIAAHGKRMIGWDEVLQAGLSPTAAIMSWHGDSVSVAALRKGHDVVMATYRYTYFDFYQSDPDLEPDITYAPLFLDTVYAFDPMPPGLSAKEGEHILGAEACLWTENVPSPARVEYMLLPRLLALSEALWTTPEKKDYAKFIVKVEELFKRLDAEKISYATSLYNIATRPVFDSSSGRVLLTLSDQADKYAIRYSLNTRKTLTAAPPFLSLTAASPLYSHPLAISGNASLQAALFKQGRRMGKISRENFILHKAAGGTIQVYPQQDEATAAASKRLVDGIFGTVEPYDGRWVGFTDSVLIFTIDLKYRQAIHSVSVRFMEDQVGDIYLPREIEWAVSGDGTHYDPVYKMQNASVPQHLLRHVVRYGKQHIGKEARWLQLTVRNANLSAAPSKNGIFLDEMVVE